MKTSTGCVEKTTLARQISTHPGVIFTPGCVDFRKYGGFCERDKTSIFKKHPSIDKNRPLRTRTYNEDASTFFELSFRMRICGAPKVLLSTHPGVKITPGCVDFA